MSEYLARLPEHATVDDVLTDVHLLTYEVTKNIPVFESGTNCENPAEGDVYSHARDTILHNQKGRYRENCVRTIVDGRGPYLLGTTSIIPDDEKEPILPIRVETYDDVFSMSKDRGIIEIGWNPPYKYKEADELPRGITRHMQDTKVNKLKQPNKRLLGAVADGILDRVAFTRCLVSIYMANQQAQTADGTDARLLEARATVADAFKLFGQR